MLKELKFALVAVAVVIGLWGLMALTSRDRPQGGALPTPAEPLQEQAEAPSGTQQTAGKPTTVTAVVTTASSAAVVAEPSRAKTLERQLERERREVERLKEPPDVLTATGVHKSVRGTVVAVSPAAKATAREGQPAACFSGVVVGVDGLIVTAAQAAAGMTEVSITRLDGARDTAKVLSVDQNTGLALLQAQATKTVPLPLGEAEAIHLRERVAAIGRSALGENRPLVLTVGVISAVGRRAGGLAELIQTDAGLGPGFSGGALVDFSGRLVGVILGGQVQRGSRIDFSLSPDDTVGGIGYAVPARLVRQLLDSHVPSKTGM